MYAIKKQCKEFLLWLRTRRALFFVAVPSSSILSTLHIFGADMGLPPTDPRIIIARLVRVAMGFIGIILLLLILSSGAQFMFSGGDEDKLNSAKSTLVNAIIGIIIILSAYSIVAFVLNTLSAAGGQTNI